MGSRHSMDRSTHRLGPDPGAVSLDLEGDAVTHTPGPWAVHPHMAYVVPESHVLRPIGGSIYPEEDRERYAQSICAMHWPDQHRTESEVHANARLIAAAPDLLSALEDCVEALQHMKDRWGTEVNPPTLNQAKAAIAKAKGET